MNKTEAKTRVDQYPHKRKRGEKREVHRKAKSIVRQRIKGFEDINSKRNYQSAINRTIEKLISFLQKKKLISRIIKKLK